MIFVIGLFIYKQSQPKYYECNMRLQSVCVNASYAINLINGWNYNMSLPQDVREKIIDLHAMYMIDYNNDGSPDAIEEYESSSMKDTTSYYTKKRMSSFLNVQVKIYIDNDSTILDTISQAVLNFISHDKFIVDEYRTIQEQNIATIERVQKEIALLDSLQTKEYFNSEKKTGVERGGEGGYLMVAEKDQRLYHNDLLTLLNKVQALERSKHSEPFLVIQNLSLPLNPINTAKYNAIYSFIVVMFFATIIIFFYDRRKAIKALAKQLGQWEDELDK